MRLMAIRLRFLTGTFFPSRGNMSRQTTKKRSTIQQRYWFSDQKIKVCCPAYVCVDPVSAVGLVSDGHRSFRCIYILSQKADGVNLQGNVFVFLFDGQGGMSPLGKGASSGWQDTPYTVQISFLGGVSPSARRAGVELCCFFYLRFCQYRFFYKIWMIF